jgi:predicted small secreted protein
MRKTLLTILLMAFAAVGLTGCHTVKGVQEDVQTVPQNLTKAGHAVLKTDDWIKENMW